MHRVAAVLLVFLAACDTDPIAWNDPKAVADAPGRGRLFVDATGNARFVTDSTLPVVPPMPPGACVNSLRTARGASRFYGAWWAVRRDSSAVLYTSVSRDQGKTWEPPVPVDTLDVSSRGCDRPPPALATSGDDLHTAYSMIAPEGTGVFFAHFMGTMLHSPVAVIYGERLVATAIAAEGDRVAVAYEEPNGSRRQVDVSISLTQGHIFERHSVASRAIDVATDPSVALNGPYIAVGWMTRRATDTVGTRVIRTGRIR